MVTHRSRSAAASVCRARVARSRSSPFSGPRRHLRRAWVQLRLSVAAGAESPASAAGPILQSGHRQRRWWRPTQAPRRRRRRELGGEAQPAVQQPCLQSPNWMRPCTAWLRLGVGGCCARVSSGDKFQSDRSEVQFPARCTLVPKKSFFVIYSVQEWVLGWARYQGRFANHGSVNVKMQDEKEKSMIPPSRSRLRGKASRRTQTTSFSTCRRRRLVRIPREPGVSVPVQWLAHSGVRRSARQRQTHKRWRRQVRP